VVPTKPHALLFGILYLCQQQRKLRVQSLVLFVQGQRAEGRRLALLYFQFERLDGLQELLNIRLSLLDVFFPFLHLLRKYRFLLFELLNPQLRSL
jgi:hypothetical protein